jgi:hypothetical protein
MVRVQGLLCISRPVLSSKLAALLLVIKPHFALPGLSHIHTKVKPQLWLGFYFGAGTGTQTLGLFLGKEALYQLSYTRVRLNFWWRLLDSNQRHEALQATALPTELRRRISSKTEVSYRIKTIFSTWESGRFTLVGEVGLPFGPGAASSRSFLVRPIPSVLSMIVTLGGRGGTRTHKPCGNEF